MNTRGSGRPEIGKPVHVRLTDSARHHVDQWAARHDVSLAEAVRRLVSHGLNATTSPDRISVNDILGRVPGMELPPTATGVRWGDAAGSYVECRAHIEDESWRIAFEPSNDMDGVLLFTGDVPWDACR